MLRNLVGAALVIGAAGCTKYAQSGAGVPVALVKHTEIMGGMATTRSVIFSGSIDNTQFCLWTVKQLRSDRNQGGDPNVVTWTCEEI